MSVSSIDNSGRELPGRGAHFLFDEGGVRFVYCYIRKNACSTFKRFFVENSTRGEWSRFSGGRRQFMVKNHRLPARHVLATDAPKLFVYRDPVDRVVSLFKNKFVWGFGNADISRDFWNKTGIRADDATFRQFVGEYLAAAGPSACDRHCWPQWDHLLPCLYDYAIPLNDLYESMSEIVGEQLATRYFSKPINATRRTRYLEVEKGVLLDVPGREIREQLSAGNYDLKNEALLSDAMEAQIRAIYSSDVRMIERIEGVSSVAR